MTIIICLFLGSLSAQNLIVPAPQSQEAIARYFEDLADDTNSLDLYYTAACYWSLAGDHENAFRCLFYLATHGFYELEWLENENDLIALRSTATWRLVILHVKSNIREMELARQKESMESKERPVKESLQLDTSTEDKSTSDSGYKN